MTVGQFCTREVVIADRDSTLSEVAKLMHHYHVGDVIVVERQGEQNIPVGIITDRDIVVQIIAQEKAPDSVTAAEVMSSRLFAARENDGIWDTLQRMSARGIRRIPVVNEKGALEGILAVEDLVELLAEELTLLAKTAVQGQVRERLQRE